MEITYTRILSIRSVTFALAMPGIAMFCATYFGSFLSLNFKKVYNIKDKDIGFYFCFNSIPYILACLTLPRYSKMISRPTQFIIHMAICSISFGLMGPSKLLNLPRNLNLILLGLILNGFISYFGFVPGLPEAVDIVLDEFEIIQGSNPQLEGILMDTVASINQLSINLSGLLSPIIGGILYDLCGYRRACDVAMVFVGVLTLIYLIFNQEK